MNTQSAYSNLDYHINELLSKNFCSRYNCQLSFFAKVTKHNNGKEHMIHKWVKSDFNYNHSIDFYSNNNTLIQNLDDE